MTSVCAELDAADKQRMSGRVVVRFIAPRWGGEPGTSMAGGGTFTDLHVNRCLPGELIEKEPVNGSDSQCLAGRRPCYNQPERSTTDYNQSPKSRFGVFEFD